ncbi:MAG: carbohydrate binding domain-containing protein [Saccharofermentanales bacterium]
MKNRILIRYACIISIVVLSLQSGMFADSAEILTNGSFDVNMEGWSAYSTATMDIRTDTPHGGKSYVYSSHKYGACDGPRQYVTEQIRFYGKGTYHVSAWIKIDSDVKCNAQVVMQTVSSDKTFGSEQYPGQYWDTTEEIPVNNKTWTKVEGDIELDWKGDLEMSEYYFLLLGDGAMANIAVDDCSLYKAGYTGAAYTPGASASTVSSGSGAGAESAGSDTDSAISGDSSVSASPIAVKTDINPFTNIIVISVALAGVALLFAGLGIVLLLSGRRDKTKGKEIV